MKIAGQDENFELLLLENSSSDVNETEAHSL
jgi:hypothetical protein